MSSSARAVERRLLQPVSQPALSEVPRSGARRMARGTPGRAAAGPLLPRRLHRAGSDRRDRLPEQGHGVRHAVPGHGRDAAHYCGRSRAPRRRDRHAGRAAHLGTKSAASSPCPLRVPGGGPSPDGTRWVAARPCFFLPVRVLSALFRRLFLERLRAAFEADKLRFFGALLDLLQPAVFARRLAAWRRIDWVVYAKRPFGGPAQVLAYLGRYTHRVAIANSRLIQLEEGRVSFRWRDYRQRGK